MRTKNQKLILNILTVSGITMFSILAAANNAAAATAGVAIGGVYRTNADPSVLCIRSGEYECGNYMQSVWYNFPHTSLEKEYC